MTPWQSDLGSPIPAPSPSAGSVVTWHRSLSHRYIGALGARVICDNIPGLVNKQRQLCQRYPDIMQSVGEGAKEWIRECQHQFRHHRWNCSTLDRDHTVFGRVMLRSRFCPVPFPPPRALSPGRVSPLAGLPCPVA